MLFHKYRLPSLPPSLDTSVQHYCALFYSPFSLFKYKSLFKNNVSSQITWILTANTLIKSQQMFSLTFCCCCVSLFFFNFFFFFFGGPSTQKKKQKQKIHFFLSSLLIFYFFFFNYNTKSFFCCCCCLLFRQTRTRPTVKLDEVQNRLQQQCLYGSDHIDLWNMDRCCVEWNELHQV